MAKTQTQHRIGLILFVVVAAAACLLLGYWQLSRFESATGTAQNLGYAFQWPAFAAFFIYAYRRFIRLEADRDAELDDLDEATNEPEAGQPAANSKKKRVWVDRDKSKMTEIPEYLLPKRAPAAASVPSPADDEGKPGKSLNEYNDYLARLSLSDSQGRDTEGHLR